MKVPLFSPCTEALQRCLHVVLFLIFSLPAAYAQHLPDAQAPQTVESGWSYHWGDIPYDGSAQQGGWQFTTDRWQPAASLDAIEGRMGEDILWLKLDLPPLSLRDPHLFLWSIDLTVQVFEAGGMIYHFGDIDLQGNSRFAGWPWHLIPIGQPESPTLYFRIYSNYPFIGPSGEVVLGNKSDLLDRVYARGMTGLVFVGIVFIVGIVSMCLGLIKRDRGRAISTGFLSFDLALMMFAENELSQVFINDPLMWRYVAAFTYFLVPAFLAWVVQKWFRYHITWLIKSVLVLSLVFVVGVWGASSFAGYTFINAYPVFDGLLIVYMLALVVACLMKAQRFNLQEKLIAFGILALFISLALDSLSAHGLIDWIGKAGQWGLICFTLALLVVYLIKDWRQQKALRILRNNLEAQVVERTQELEESKARLEQLAREDFLTGLLNRRAFMELANREVVNSKRHQRPLSLILFDIDFFKDINDLHGHDVGDSVLREISKATLSICREGDLVCRYGGEEFVILLHATARENAINLANRLQSAIKSVCVTTEAGEPVHVTASFGLIAYTGYQDSAQESESKSPEKLLHFLLMQADRAMYDVKNAGRDDIKVYEVNVDAA